MLWYNSRAHQSSPRLPWPFPTLKGQEFSLDVKTVTRLPGLPPLPDKLLRKVDFSSQDEYHIAISCFLQGAQPHDKVMVAPPE